MKTQTPLAPHAGTFNGGEGIKTIRQHSYSPNTARADFFCFTEVKSKLADLSLSQGSLTTN
jgi:hypothetical protein